MKTSRNKVAALAAVMIFFGISAAVAVPVTVTVQKVEGTVETRTSAAAAWAKAASGDKLSAGASVKTGPGSSCILRWGDAHVLKLQALSSLDISKIDLDDTGKENSGFDLTKGTINAHAKKLRTKDSTFTVKTPIAMAGVRGTDLFVSVAEDNTSTFGVTEGEIYVEAGGIETIVMQDYILTVGPAGAPGAHEPMTVEMKQEAADQIQEAKQEAQMEPEDKGKEEEKKSTGEQGKGIDKQEEKAAAEGKETGAETAAEMDATADAVDSVINNATDQQLMNDIVEAARQQIYETGQFEVDIYVEP